MAQLSDTSAEIDARLTEIFRDMPFSRKWEMLGEMFRTARTLHAAGCRARTPGATAAEVHEDWLVRLWGEDVVQSLKEKGFVGR